MMFWLTHKRVLQECFDCSGDGWFYGGDRCMSCGGTGVDEVYIARPWLMLWWRLTQ
jgi:DnaJ-class molecular chaperone